MILAKALLRLGIFFSNALIAMVVITKAPCTLEYSIYFPHTLNTFECTHVSNGTVSSNN